MYIIVNERTQLDLDHFLIVNVGPKLFFFFEGGGGGGGDNELN